MPAVGGRKVAQVWQGHNIMYGTAMLLFKNKFVVATKCPKNTTHTACPITITYTNGCYPCLINHGNAYATNEHSRRRCSRCAHAMSHK